MGLIFALILAAGGAETFEKVCDPNAREISSWIEQRQLFVCGEINSSMRASIIGTDHDLFDSIVFSSGGGDSLIAYEIGDFLIEYEKEAHFSGFCGSACVTLFVVADSAYVGETAFFLNHDSYIGRLSMMRRSGHWEQGGVELEEAAYATLQSFESINTDDLNDYYFDTTAALEPICAGVLFHDGLGHDNRSLRVFNAAYRAWAPSEQTLLRWREGRATENLSGHYDATIEQRRSGVAGFLPNIEILSLSDDAVINRRVAFSRTEIFPVCDIFSDKN